MSVDITTLPSDGRAGTPESSRPRRRRRTVLAAGLAGVVVVGAVVWRAAAGPGEEGGEATGAVATATTPVVRQDLTARSDVDGTLGYSGSTTVTNRLQGTVTALPEVGSVVDRGQPLYSVDSRPVPLLFGDVPAWRRLAVGVPDGADVHQLEANLVALGYATESQLKVDDHFDSATAAAVRRWQKALGVEQTGAVELGEAVFLPGKVRVAERTVAKGDATAPGAPVVKVTSTNRQVRVELDAAKQSTVKVGDEVEVKLPSGQTTKGSVASVGTVATSKGSPPNTKSVVEVIVTLHDPAAAGSVDEAPVRVGFVSGSRKGVLTVPVNALLALREGGYGVRVVDGASSRIVPVTTGLFARGLVEVSGEGLAEGQQVEVPAS